MNRRNLIVLAAAAVIGLFAVLLVNAWFSGVEEQQADLATDNRPLGQLVVARQKLEFGTPITQDNVRLVEWPQASMPAGAFTDISHVVNGTRVALRPIEIGEPLLAARVSGTDGRASMASNIPGDMRAVSLPVSEVTGVGGFVTPGDVVDIFLTRQVSGDGASGDDKVISVLLENVQVLAIDQRSDDKNTDPAVVNTATVLTDLDGAQKLSLARQIGTLSLALRNIENQTVGAVRNLTARDLPGGRLYIAARPTRSAPSAAAPAVAISAPSAPTVRRPSGPTMTIFRGTDDSLYEVNRYGLR